MKKTILTVAFVAIAMVSCKDNTKEKMEDASDAIKTEVTQEMDTLADKAETAADSAKAKTAKVLEKSAEKIDKAAEKLKTDSKK